MDIIALLPQLIPLACEWAETQSQYILENGVPLTEGGLALAVGVRNPDRIRILSLDVMPKPDNPLLATAAEQLHFLGPDTSGLTLGYGIFIHKQHIGNPELIAHECRHVYQYEQHGSIRSYLEVYIPDLLKYGYSNAPLEIDAREAEAKGRRNGLRLV